MSSEQIIWDFLMKDIKNPYGVAGLMGNLYAESRLNPGLLESKYRNRLGMTSDQYTESVDNGTYNNFTNDCAGYGLAQWTYWSRKEAFLNFMKSRNVSISDLNSQLMFIVDEIKKYKTVYRTLLTTDSIREASDVVMERYEKCANQTESNKETRASFGKVFYDKYMNVSPKKVVMATDTVNIRCGNGESYAKVGIALTGNKFDYVVTSDNGWYAIVFGDRVAWVKSEFAILAEEIV